MRIFLAALLATALTQPAHAFTHERVEYGLLVPQEEAHYDAMPAKAWRPGVEVAQVGFGGNFPGPGTVHSAGGGGFSSQGDVKSFSMWWGTYAYSAATRGTNAVRVCDHNNLNCTDLVSDATTGIVANPTLGGVACNTSTNQCTIKIFYDQSGNGFTLTQTTASDRALWMPAGNCPIGSTVSCGYGTGATYETASNVTQNVPWAFSWVSNRNASTGTDTNVSGSASSSIDIGSGYFGANNNSHCLDLSVSSTDANAHAVTCSVNGGSSHIRVDTTNTPGAASGGNWSATHVGFFSSAGGGRNWQGYIASGGMIAGTISTTDTTNLNAAAHTVLGF